LINPFLKLIKYRLSLAVTLSAIAGYMLNRGTSDPRLLPVIGGVFLMAAGSAALNEYQEKSYDALMERTRNRPIPAGRISPSVALVISCLLIIGGAGILFLSGTVPMALGIVTVVVYNGMYTWLKRKTSFAVLPGGLVGALPPLIGWTAAGGFLLHPKIMFVATLMFLWQVPHFWLLIIRYRQEYETAGFTTIWKYLHENQIKRLIFLWMTVSSLFLFMAPLFGLNLRVWLLIPLACLNTGFIGFFCYVIFRKPSPGNLRLVFILTNLFLTIILLAFILNSLRLT
jgi:heme o synthase